jgi:hypothetical protein
MNFVLEQLTTLSKEHNRKPIVLFHELFNRYFQDILPEPKITYSGGLISEVEFDNEDIPSVERLDLPKYGEVKNQIEGHRSYLQKLISDLKQQPPGPDRDQSLAILSRFDERWFSTPNVGIKDGKPILYIWGVKPKHFPSNIDLIKRTKPKIDETKEESLPLPPDPTRKRLSNKSQVFIAAIILIFSFAYLTIKNSNSDSPYFLEKPDDPEKPWGQRNLTLSGTVRDSKSIPIPDSNVMLSVFSNYDSSFPRKTTTNVMGDFFFHELSYGTYALEVEKKGYDYVRRPVSLSENKMSKNIPNARYIPITIEKLNIFELILSKVENLIK